MKMKAIKCPRSDELYRCNFVIVCPEDFDDSVRYVEVNTGVGSFIFSIKRYGEMPSGSIGFNLLQQQWAVLSPFQDIDVRPYVIDRDTYGLTKIELEDFLPNMNKSLYIEPYDSDRMADAFLTQFHMQSLSIGQKLFFRFKNMMLFVVVKDLKVVDMNAMRGGSEDISRSNQFGVCLCSCCSPKIVVTLAKRDTPL